MAMSEDHAVKVEACRGCNAAANAMPRTERAHHPLSNCTIACASTAYLWRVLGGLCLTLGAFVPPFVDHVKLMLGMPEPIEQQLSLGPNLRSGAVLVIWLAGVALFTARPDVPTRAKHPAATSLVTRLAVMFTCIVSSLAIGSVIHPPLSVWLYVNWKHSYLAMSVANLVLYLVYAVSAARYVRWMVSRGMHPVLSRVCTVCSWASPALLLLGLFIAPMWLAGMLVLQVPLAAGAVVAASALRMRMEQKLAVTGT